ncbi:Scr1 family TA system antitoxin-like transcriptional regulator [Streptomyces sp. NPDC051162]|uniref:Scr1 family TA system antitoxin-like transcriptional regulator n=1 Tax=Streptomyces sp. NPDC051162 TaxID=3154747 RepID=UPI0034242B5D
MPPRTAPTVRQRRLGTELRKLREAAGISTQDAATLLGVNRTRIPNIEAGRFGLTADRVRTLALNYGCAETELINALAGIAQERGHRWWESYRGTLPSGFLDVAELEHHATAIRMFLMVHMPGLLQTAEHARAAFEKSLVSLPSREIELRAIHRMRRQEILTLRENPPEFTAIIHEAALRMQFGGPRITRTQLSHLLAMSERSNITIRALPFDAQGFAGPGQPICYAHGPVPQLDTVQLDSFHGPAFIDSDDQLRRYRVLLDEMETMSLSPDRTRELIHSIIQQL